MTEVNTGISHAGVGDINMTDSPISFGGGSGDGSTGGRPGGRAANVPFLHTGTGGVTVGGGPVEPVTARGTGDINVGPGSGVGSSKGRNYSTWDDIPGGNATSGGATSRWGGSTTGGAGGGGMGEFGDLASVRRFAEQVCALGEGSDFVQVIKACGGLRDMMRDLGGDVNREVAAFMDAATAVARDGEELKEQAAMVARLAVDLSGG